MQDLGRRSQKLFLLFPAWFRLKSLKWAYRLAQENFAPSETEGLSVRDGNLVNTRTGIAITDQVYPLVKGGIRYWKDFSNYNGVSFFGLDAGKLVTVIDGIRFQVDHSGSLFVLDEIFSERLYDLRVDEALVGLDIGMNIGAASLYLASRPNISKVYSYEPLGATFEQARRNFSLNPSIGQKIHPEQKGVSDYAGTIEVPEAAPGSAVFSTDKDFIDTLGSQSARIVSIPITPVQEILDKIATEHPGKRVFLKLDCEGEEYKIMDAIAAAGRLGMISVIALEWHFKGFATLCQLLEDNGFSVFNLGRKEIEPPCGMIYAFNMKKQTHA